MQGAGFPKPDCEVECSGGEKCCTFQTPLTPLWLSRKRGTPSYLGRSKRFYRIAPHAFSLPLQILKRLFYLLFGLRAGRGEGQARDAAVVSVQIHGVFQAGDAVFHGYQAGGVRDAVLPVQAGDFLALQMRLPNGDAGIWGGVGVRQDAAAGAHQQGGPQRGGGANQNVAKSPKWRNTPVILGEFDPEGCGACSAQKNPQNGYRNGAVYASYTAEALNNTLALAEREHIDRK